jgi:hypothetical protein
MLWVFHEVREVREWVELGAAAVRSCSSWGG